MILQPSCGPDEPTAGAVTRVAVAAPRAGQLFHDPSDRRQTCLPMSPRQTRPDAGDANAASVQPGLRMSVEVLSKELQTQIAKGKRISAVPITTELTLDVAGAGYRSWDEYNRTLLGQAFTTSAVADEYNTVNKVTPSPIIMGGGEPPLDQRVESFLSRVDEAVRRLESVDEQLVIYRLVSKESEEGASLGVPLGRDVFIVHGHNNDVKSETARAIEQLTGRPPVILHEQADKGRTIIEKFEQHAVDIGYAVVLLTADDEGSVKGGDQQPRARQNVVFEMGYFIARLGRDRVTLLLAPGVEQPSNLNGVLYTPIDAEGAWRYKLGREMQAVEIDADLNRVK